MKNCIIIVSINRFFMQRLPANFILFLFCTVKYTELRIVNRNITKWPMGNIKGRSAFFHWWIMHSNRSRNRIMKKGFWNLPWASRCCPAASCAAKNTSSWFWPTCHCAYPNDRKRNGKQKLFSSNSSNQQQAWHFENVKI